MIPNSKNIFLVFVCLFIIFKNQTINAEEIHTKSVYLTFNNSVLEISKIKKNSPAYNSGLRINDKIMKFGNYKFDDWQESYGRDFLYQLNKIKNEETSITVLRKNKIFEFKITPKLISPNQYGIGISTFKEKCQRSSKNNGEMISFSEDEAYHKCIHDIDIKKDVYLKDLDKKSDDYAYLFYEKISVKYRLARNFLEIRPIFDIKKAEKIFIDAFNLSKNLSSKKNSDYAFQESYSSAFFAYNLGILFSNYYVSSLSNTTFEDFIDYPKAIKWLSIASKENHRNALHILSLINLKNRLGVKANKKKAFNYIGKATRLGLGEGNYELAHFHLFGLGGAKKNYSKSLLHFKLASTARFNNSADLYNIYLLHKYNRLPIDTFEYYSWLVENLQNSKTITAVEKTANFAFKYLDNYSESFKWYEICSKKNISKLWLKNLRAPIGKSWRLQALNKRCLAKSDLYKKLYLNKNEITKGQIFATKWIDQYINQTK